MWLHMHTCVCVCVCEFERESACCYCKLPCAPTLFGRWVLWKSLLLLLVRGHQLYQSLWWFTAHDRGHRYRFWFYFIACLLLYFSVIKQIGQTALYRYHNYSLIFVVVQDYLLGHLSELLSHHVYQDSCGVLGEAIIELGRAETFAIRRSRNQAGAVCSLNQIVKAITKQIKKQKKFTNRTCENPSYPLPNNDINTHAHTRMHACTHAHTIFHTLTLLVTYFVWTDRGERQCWLIEICREEEWVWFWREREKQSA